MNLDQSWTAFGGASLALMGVSLVAGARRMAVDNLAWRREWGRATGREQDPNQDGRALAFVYWGAGALISGAGFGILSAGQPVVAGPAHSRLAGFLITGVGAGAGALKFIARSRGPRFLDGETAVGQSRPFDERAAEAATWTLCSLWSAFGVALALGYWR